MRVRLLGTSAGGGFPQWNCACRVCQAAREGGARPRLQSSVAVSADGAHWFLLNASPDVRFQIEAFAPLRPPRGALRGSGIEAVLLTNADLDHTLGLLLLREGGAMRTYATSPTRRSLQAGLRLPTLLKAYGGSDFVVPPRKLMPLPLADGSPTGLRFMAFPVPGKPPRYLEATRTFARFDNVGYRIEEPASGARLLFIPDLAAIDAAVEDQLERCDLLLFDGTFWDEREMLPLGGRPAAAMAHQPVGGPDGSLRRLAPLPIARKIYIHINNSNPMLLEHSPERELVLAAGLEIAQDGMEIEL
jgi:pyrroloquinoline quinone biosynthesis protein B